MDPTVFFVITMGVMVAFVLIAATIIRKCYLVVPADKAIVKTGFGPMDVTTAGGILVYPVINQVHLLSLAWVPIEAHFPDSQPLKFDDQSTLVANVTIWIAIETTEESLKEAAQSFGERAGDPELMNKLFANDLELAIRKAAQGGDRSEWMENLPDVSPDVFRELEEVVGPCITVHRVSVSLESEQATHI